MALPIWPTGSSAERATARVTRHHRFYANNSSLLLWPKPRVCAFASAPRTSTFARAETPSVDEPKSVLRLSPIVLPLRSSCSTISQARLVLPYQRSLLFRSSKSVSFARRGHVLRDASRESRTACAPREPPRPRICGGEQRPGLRDVGRCELNPDPCRPFSVLPRSVWDRSTGSLRYVVSPLPSLRALLAPDQALLNAMASHRRSTAMCALSFRSPRLPLQWRSPVTNRGRHPKPRGEHLIDSHRRLSKCLAAFRLQKRIPEVP